MLFGLEVEFSEVLLGAGTVAAAVVVPFVAFNDEVGVAVLVLSVEEADTVMLSNPGIEESCNFHHNQL